MNLQQAMTLLGVTQKDDEREIKRKYHKMISRFHPDSLNEVGEAHIQRSQEINEAYRILCQSDKWEMKSGQGTEAHGTDNHRYGKREQRQEWSGELNEAAFIPRNIYLHYSMNLSEEERKEAQGKLYYQAAQGKYMWDPEEEDFTLFLTSLRHATAALLERTENAVNSEDLSCMPDLKEYRFRIQAKLFEYLSMQYVNPLLVLDSLTKPESTDGKGQRIYRFKAFVASEASSPEGRLIASLRPGEYLFPKAFHGNQIQLMNKNRQVLGYLHMEDDRLYFCIIPLLKKHAAQVKLLVKEEDTGAKGKNNGIHNKTNSNNSRNSGRGITRGNNKRKANIDFYFRLEDENYTYNSSDLNLKIAETLAGYEKYLRKYSPEQERFCDLFARLSRSNFRSRFHLKDKDIQYIREKGMDTIRSHAADFVRTRLAPAQIPNDGKQTPMRGHPVFLAQHATGCCCRGCLYKWHRIPAGVQLTEVQQEYIVDVLMAWIEKEYNRNV